MRWEEAFDPDARSAAQCRRVVLAWLRDAGCPPQVIDDALLLEAELVGNAIRHARTPFTLTVSMERGRLRLAVFDRDSRPPALMGLNAESTSGRGLNIVAALAHEWGWDTAQDQEGVSGKVVWAELLLDPSSGQ